MVEKLKSLVTDDRIFMSATVVLVAMVSFLLGRLSVGEGIEGRGLGASLPMAPVTMTYTGSAATATAREVVGPAKGSSVSAEANGEYVASKSGSKYHHPDCVGAKRIKEENRVYFSSEAEARAAGYTPAANCSQLNN